MNKRLIKRKRARKERGAEGGDDSIPVESFSDIAFLLIIFFILTTTFTVTQGLDPEIPSGQKGEEDSGDKTPTIAVTGAGIRWNDNPITPTDLRVKLAALRLPEKEPQNRVILLESTDEVVYEVYYHVVGAIQGAGGAIAIVDE